jgi:putative oxidoreductase
MSTAAASLSPNGASARASWLWLVLRLALAAVFAYAGVLKLADPTGFAVEIDHYQLMPFLAPYLAAALPALELTLALALVVLPAPWRRAAALGCLLLMIAFTVGAASAMARNLDIDCGCFGKGSGPITWVTIARDLALIAVCAVLTRRA